MDDNNVSLEELRRWISENDIPNTPPYKRTLLDIVGCAHHENNWSDIYKFFLREKEEHGLGDLFIRSLEKVINKDKGWMQDFCIIREEGAKDGENNQEESSQQDAINKKKQGRIDLLILGAKKRAIIIENKVHATIEGNGNPLLTYKTSVEKRGYEEIKGIVLAVSNNNNDIKITREAGYDYITHLDFIAEVERNLDKYKSKANPLYLPLLYDFIQTIKNITNQKVTMKQNEFFFENYDKIKAINNIYSNIVREYKNAFNAKNKKEYFKSLSLENDYKSFDDKEIVYLKYSDSDLYLTIVLNYLWDKIEQNKAKINKPFVRMIIEHRGKRIAKKHEGIEIAKQYCDNKDIHSTVASDENGYWQHFAYCDIIVEEVNPENVVKAISNALTKEKPIYILLKKIAECIK